MPSMLNTFLPVFQDTVLKFDTTTLLVACVSLYTMFFASLTGSI